jgi:ABC-type glycerol-3-phosphate transport system substrate-binding protein
MRRVKAISSLVFMGSFIVSGCSSSTSSSSGDKAPEKVSPPVTLELSSSGSSTVVDEDFQNVVNEFIKKKYPHITVNFNPDAGNTKLDGLLAAGIVPDLFVTYNGALAGYKDKDLLVDMTPMFKQANVDLGRIENNYITDVRNASDKGELYGLPFMISYHALYYNKGIFDKFGVAYPRDGTTWEELVELARKVTRMDAGTQYRGLDPGNNQVWMSQPLGIAAIDPKTDKAIMNTDQWKRVFELAKSIYNIPGNGMIAESPKNQFMKSKTLAMLLDLNILSQLSTAQKEGLDWDIAQYPIYKEKPNMYGNASVSVMIATKQSKHHDDAVKVIDLITSEEVQLALSKMGRMSPLKSGQVKQALGSTDPQLKDKHLPSIFKSTPVPYPIASQFRSKAEGIGAAKFKEYIIGSIDVNTALRQADEEIDKMVGTEKAK